MDDQHLVFLAPVVSELSFSIATKLAPKGFRIIFLSDDEDLLELLAFEIENLGGMPYPVYCSLNSENAFRDAIMFNVKKVGNPSTIVIFSEKDRDANEPNANKMFKILGEQDWFNTGSNRKDCLLVDLREYSESPFLEAEHNYPFSDVIVLQNWKTNENTNEEAFTEMVVQKILYAAQKPVRKFNIRKIITQLKFW